MIFTAADYDILASIVFQPDYPGNATARGVIESPNGDGKLDTGKRYAHVAIKYLDKMDTENNHRGVLWNALYAAYTQAMRVASRLQVPDAFLPSFEHGALRVLEYPPGAGSEVHTDVGLLTLMCYRDQPEHFHYAGKGHTESLAHDLDPQLHMGRIAREIGMVPAADAHYVSGSATTQHSIVYFAVPDHDATLPNGQRLGDWLDREMQKMRY